LLNLLRVSVSVDVRALTISRGTGILGWSESGRGGVRQSRRKAEKRRNEPYRRSRVPLWLIIPSATPLTGHEDTGSGWRPALGVCSGVSYPSPTRLVTAGGAQDGQTLQMIQHLRPLAVFMCPPNLPSLPPPPPSLPPSLAPSLPDPHLPHLSQTPWIPPPPFSPPPL